MNSLQQQVTALMLVARQKEVSADVERHISKLCVGGVRITEYQVNIKVARPSETDNSGSCKDIDDIVVGNLSAECTWRDSLAAYYYFSVIESLVHARRHSSSDKSSVDGVCVASLVPPGDGVEVCGKAGSPVEVCGKAGSPGDGVEVCGKAGSPGDGVEVCGKAGSPVEVCGKAGSPGDGVEVCGKVGSPEEDCGKAGSPGDGVEVCGKAGSPGDGVEVCGKAGSLGDGVEVCGKAGSPGDGVEVCGKAGSLGDGMEVCGKAGSPGDGVEVCGKAGSLGDGVEVCGKAGSPGDSVEVCGKAGSPGDGVEVCGKAGSDGLEVCGKAGSLGDGVEVCGKAGSPGDGVEVCGKAGSPGDGVEVCGKAGSPRPCDYCQTVLESTYSVGVARNDPADLASVGNGIGSMCVLSVADLCEISRHLLWGVHATGCQLAAALLCVQRAVGMQTGKGANLRLAASLAVTILAENEPSVDDTVVEGSDRLSRELSGEYVPMTSCATNAMKQRRPHELILMSPVKSNRNLSFLSSPTPNNETIEEFEEMSPETDVCSSQCAGDELPSLSVEQTQTYPQATTVFPNEPLEPKDTMPVPFAKSLGHANNENATDGANDVGMLPETSCEVNTSTLVVGFVNHKAAAESEYIAVNGNVDMTEPLNGRQTTGRPDLAPECTNMEASAATQGPEMPDEWYGLAPDIRYTQAGVTLSQLEQERDRITRQLQLLPSGVKVMSN